MNTVSLGTVQSFFQGAYSRQAGGVARFQHDLVHTTAGREAIQSGWPCHALWHARAGLDLAYYRSNGNLSRVDR
jgi:hypothetical protein